MVGGIVVALVLSKYPSLFKHAGITVPVCTLITLGIFIYACVLADEVFIQVAIGLNGFSSLSIFAVAYEMAVL